MAGRLSKRVENTVGKWEIACNFSFSHDVFKGLVLQTLKNKGLFGRKLRFTLMREQQIWLY